MTRNRMSERVLRVVVPASFGRLLIAHALPRFQRSRDGLRVALREADSTGAALAELARGADAAICVGPVCAPRALLRRIGTVRNVTCAAPEVVERDGRARRPADLDAAQCIGMLLPYSDRVRDWQFERHGVLVALSPTGPLAFDDPEMAVAAAVRAGGYVRLLGFEADREIACGMLQPVLEDWNENPMPVFMVEARRYAANADAAAFADFVARMLPIEEIEGDERPTALAAGA